MSDATVEHQEVGPPRRATGRLGWLYLGLLAVVALVVGVVALGSDGDGGGTRALPGVVQPVELVLRVDRTEVALEGRVPDEDVRRRLVELAAARFGRSHVDERLDLDQRTTLDGGQVAVTGSTTRGAPDPLALQADIVAALVLRNGPVDLAADPAEVDQGPSVAMVPPSR